MRVTLLILQFFFTLTISYSQIEDCILYSSLNDFYLIELDSGKVLTKGNLDSKVLGGLSTPNKEVVYLTSKNNELVMWNVKTSSILLKKEFPHFIFISKYFEKDNLLYLSSHDVKGRYLYIVNSLTLEVIKKVVLSEIPGFTNYFSIAHIASKDSIILTNASELKSYTLSLSENEIVFNQKYDDISNMIYGARSLKTIKCKTLDHSDYNNMQINYESSLDINDWSCSCNEEGYNFDKDKVLEREIKVLYKTKALSIPNSLGLSVLKNNRILSTGFYHYSLYDIDTGKQIWYLDFDF